jgi:hypothetical protein
MFQKEGYIYFDGTEQKDEVRPWICENVEVSDSLENWGMILETKLCDYKKTSTKRS